MKKCESKKYQNRKFVFVVSMLICGLIFLSQTAFADSMDPEDDVKSNSFSSYFDGSTGCLTVTGNGKIEGISYKKNADGSVSTQNLWGIRTQDYQKVKRIVIGDGITEIAAAAFANLSAVTTVQLPRTIKKIGDYAFYRCKMLKTISIPEKTETVGKYAFYGCSKLGKVQIGEKLSVLGEYAFYGCSSLCKIEVDNTNEHFVVKEDTLYSVDKKTIYQYMVGISGSVNLLTSTEKIKPGAFAYGKFTKVKIPKKVKKITADVFSNCSNLKKVELSGNVKEIGNRAFYHCIRLQKITIPDSVHKIGKKAVGFCLKKKKQRGVWIQSVCKQKKFCLYAKKRSAAYRYAKKNHLKWKKAS